MADWDRVDFSPQEWVDDFLRVLKPTGNLFIFTTYNQIGEWYNCLDKRFDTTQFMIWHKTNPAPKIFKAGFLRPERLTDPKHPTQKPTSILKKIITIASRSGDVVFDPFMGVGSTGIASLALGRKFIGFELDEVYFNAAKERIEIRKF